MKKRHADQAVLMLTMIIGAMDCMKIDNAFAKIELKNAIKETSNLSRRAIEQWPTMKNWPRIKEKFSLFVDVVNPPERTDEYTPLEMTYIAQQLAIDLQEIYSVGTRGKLVKPILPGIEKLINHMDPDGKDFQKAEAAGSNMDKLYEIIGLDPDKQIGKTKIKVAA